MREHEYLTDLSRVFRALRLGKKVYTKRSRHNKDAWRQIGLSDALGEQDGMLYYMDAPYVCVAVAEDRLFRIEYDDHK